MFRLALALLLAMVPFGAGANQLSVWPNGSDEGQCEPDSPCATIGRACSVANSSADRETSIAVTGGVYRHNTSCNIAASLETGERTHDFPKPWGARKISDGDPSSGRGGDRPLLIVRNSLAPYCFEKMALAGTGTSDETRTEVGRTGYGAVDGRP